MAFWIARASTRDVLVIHSLGLFPSRRGVLASSFEDFNTDALIVVIGDPSVGFEHEFEKGHGEVDKGWISKTLLLLGQGGLQAD